MDEFGENENKFSLEEVTQIVQEILESTLGGATYQQSKIEVWTNQITDSCLSKLSSLEKPFKYCVTVTIMQKTGAGLQAASSCYWDSETDGMTTVQYENKSMQSIVSVFGLGL